MTNKPVTVMVTYRPKPGRESELLGLLLKHWPALHEAGLVTSTPALLYRAVEKAGGRPYFVEIFSWKDDNQSFLAHGNPNVAKVWEPMGTILEGGPSPQLAVVDPIIG
jgi:hypothetical protein